MQKSILTVGQLRQAMAGLHDDCTVEVTVNGTGYGDGIFAEKDNDGEAAWLGIHVEA